MLEQVTFKKIPKYIQQLNRNRYAGFVDWRLPTLEEAMSLVEPKARGGLNIDEIFFHMGLDLFNWTADKNGDKVWFVNYSDGLCWDEDWHNVETGFAVRAVCSGKLSLCLL